MEEIKDTFERINFRNHKRPALSEANLNRMSDTIDILESLLIRLNEDVESKSALSVTNVMYSDVIDTLFIVMGSGDILEIGPIGAVKGIKGDREKTYRVGHINITPEHIGALSLRDGGTIGDPDDVNIQVLPAGLVGDGDSSTITRFYQIDTQNLDVEDAEIETLTASMIYLSGLGDLDIGGETLEDLVGRLIKENGGGGETGGSVGVVTQNLDMAGHNITNLNKLFAKEANGLEMDMDSVKGTMDMGWRQGVVNPDNVDFPIGLHMSRDSLTVLLRVAYSLVKLTGETWELSNGEHQTSVRSSGNTLTITSRGAGGGGGDVEVEASNDLNLRSSENIRATATSIHQDSDRATMKARDFDIIGEEVDLVGTKRVQLYSDKTMHIQNRGGKAYFAASSEICIIPGKRESDDWDALPESANRVRIFGHVYPQSESYTLGRSGGNSWDAVYSTNGVIQTSDRTAKNTIKELSEETARGLIMGLKPSTYQMNNGTSGRTHWGLISQDVEELLKKLEMNTGDFAGFIKSPKTRMTEKEIEYEVEKDGKILTEKTTAIEEEVIEGDYVYGLRYEEFIAPLIRLVQAHQKIIERHQETIGRQQEALAELRDMALAQQEEIRALKAGRAELEERLAKLEERLGF